MFSHITPIIKRNLFLFFVLMSVMVHGQTAPQDTAALPNPPIYISYCYSQTVHGRVLPTSGTNFNFGLNIAKLFKQKYFLGLTLEWRSSKVFGSNRKYGRIRSDINAHINYNQPNATDSLRADFLFDAFNSDSKRHFFGSIFYRYGILFSPFPDKYGGFMLAVTRGSNEFPIDGAYGVTELKYESEEYIFLKVPVDINVQLTCKPFLFIHKKRQGKYIDVISKNIFLSVFWSRISMNRAEINKSRLTNFLAPAFFEKNGTDNHFGFKVCFGFY